MLLLESSIADRARPMSVSSPNASAWLSVVPSPNLGVALSPTEMQFGLRSWLGLPNTAPALKWWLGVPNTAPDTFCNLCQDKLLTNHRAFTCKKRP